MARTFISPTFRNQTHQIVQGQGVVQNSGQGLVHEGIDRFVFLAQNRGVIRVSGNAPQTEK